MAVARAKATDITRFDLAATVAMIVITPWGWADYFVPALLPEQHSRAGASMRRRN